MSALQSGNIALDTFIKKIKKLGGLEGEDEECNRENLDPRTIKTYSVNEELNKQLLYVDICKVVSELKGNKACVMDNVVNDFIKYYPWNLSMLY